MAHGNTASERSATGRESFDGLNELYEELLDDAFVQRLATRIAEHLNQRDSTLGEAELLDAHAVARLLGCNRAFVYEHQVELGAVKLGRGSRARLRFEAERVKEFMVRQGEPRPSVAPPTRRPARRRRPTGKVELLPIKGPRP